MRYVSWLEGWLGGLFGHLLTEWQPDRRAGAGGPFIRPPAAELSNEDLFYLAMLGPHV
ncbi:MAG: hypothetical protein E6575_07780 [Bradyrhizobium sp.]|nr:hypothetical protein [Bradyrhizobium sp.]